MNGDTNIQQSNNLHGLFQLANNFYTRKQYASTEIIYNEIIKKYPNNSQAFFELGNLLQKIKRFNDSENAYKKAISINSKFPEAYNNLGFLLCLQNNLDAAKKNYINAIKYKTDYLDAYYNLGNLLYLQKDLSASETMFTKALEINQNHYPSYFGLANINNDNNNFEYAEKLYRKSIQINPNYSEAYNNLGNVLQNQNKVYEALKAYNTAIQLNPDFSEAYNNIGFVLKNKGDINSSNVFLKKAIEISPKYDMAHWNYSLNLLLQGDFSKGWDEYEWRIPANNDINLEFYIKNKNKLWDGENISKKILLITPEQGLGDYIQFFRYVFILSPSVKNIIILVPEKLLELLSNSKLPKNVSMIPSNDSIPYFDKFLPLLSIPKVTKTQSTSIPKNISYINPEKHRVDLWKEKVKKLNGKKIGLVWQGSNNNKHDKYRSISLSLFEPLFEIPSLNFISLQKGFGEDQISSYKFESKLISFTDSLDNGNDAFIDSAALIQSLDLVITVDTAIAHLAGTLGKPVWTLLCTVPDWRWLLDRKDTPWYPSMKLYRQKEQGTWQETINEIYNDLNNEIYD